MPIRRSTYRGSSSGKLRAAKCGQQKKPPNLAERGLAYVLKLGGELDAQGGKQKLDVGYCGAESYPKRDDYPLGSPRREEGFVHLVNLGFHILDLRFEARQSFVFTSRHFALAFFSSSARNRS